MTSQVTLLNAQGVAQASDSAVTIGGDQTFPTAQKIFSLGEDHKIAIMVCDSANYVPGHISWEQVVGMFAREILGDQKPHFGDYVDEFINYVTTKKDLNPPKAYSLSLQSALWGFLNSAPSIMAHTQLLKSVKKFEVIENHRIANLSNESSDEDEVKLLGEQKKERQKNQRKQIKMSFENIVKEFTGIRDIMNQVIGKRRKSDKAFKNKWLYLQNNEVQDDIEVISTNFIASLQMLLPTTLLGKIELDQDLVKELCFNQLALADFGEITHLQEHAQVTIVGFGRDDTNPMMVELDCYLDVNEANLRTPLRVKTKFVLRTRESIFDNGKLLEWCDDCKSKDGTRVVADRNICPNCDDGESSPTRPSLLAASAFIRGAAQDDEIDNVVNGIHSGVKKDLRDYPYHLTQILEGGIKDDLSKISGIGPGTMAKIDGIFKQNISDAITGTAGRLLHSKMQDIEIDRRQNFREIISLLPVVEMATLARHLIHHQSEMVRYLRSVRSVGGDVQLVTITKQDGVCIHDGEKFVSMKRITD